MRLRGQITCLRELSEQVISAERLVTVYKGPKGGVA